MTFHIVKNMNALIVGGKNDKAWWMDNTKGEFIVKSVYQNLRHKKEEVEWSKNV